MVTVATHSSGFLTYKPSHMHTKGNVGRAVHAPAHITEKVVQLFKRKSEFTFLASIQQKSSTSGVIFSIHESEHSLNDSIPLRILRLPDLPHLSS
ncbi:hypothetical protein JOQ06_009169, partial [Pogonophryne albipinna]